MSLQLPIYILAGGKSSRFGSDKARALLDGVPLIVRVAEALRPIASRLTVVAESAGKYDDLHFTTIADLIPKAGPMGGLSAAVADLCADEQWLFLASCDLLTVKPAWVGALWVHRGQTPAVAFKPGHWEPLAALYHRSIASEVSRRIGEGRLAMHDLLDGVAAVVAPLPDDWPTVLQANTKRDLKRFGSVRSK